MKRTAENIIQSLQNVAPGYDGLYRKIAEALNRKTLHVDMIFATVCRWTNFWLLCSPLADERHVSRVLLPQWCEALTPPKELEEMRRTIAQHFSTLN